MAMVALAVPWGTKADPALAARPASSVALAPHSVYVVQAGDTVASIAQRLGSPSDRSVLMTALSVQAGPNGVRPGERLVLP